MSVLENEVMDAENNGGGWVPILFHEICDACDQYSTSAADYRVWLTMRWKDYSRQSSRVTSAGISHVS